MRAENRTLVAGILIALLLLAGLTAGPGVPSASASGMDITATGGDGTSVDRDGTQGDFGNSVQGEADDDGDQDAYLNSSEEATPQIVAKK